MTKTISIEGMSCQHCVKAVQEALLAVEGVSGVNVDLEANNAVVTLSDAVEDSALSFAVTDAGYDVLAIA